jgi:hypothetical protein
MVTTNGFSSKQEVRVIKIYCRNADHGSASNLLIIVHVSYCGGETS